MPNLFTPRGGATRAACIGLGVFTSAQGFPSRVYATRLTWDRPRDEVFDERWRTLTSDPIERVSEGCAALIIEPLPIALASRSLASAFNAWKRAGRKGADGHEPSEPTNWTASTEVPESLRVLWDQTCALVRYIDDGVVVTSGKRHAALRNILQSTPWFFVLSRRLQEVAARDLGVRFQPGGELLDAMHGAAHGKGWLDGRAPAAAGLTAARKRAAAVIALRVDGASPTEVGRFLLGDAHSVASANAPVKAASAYFKDVVSGDALHPVLVPLVHEPPVKPGRRGAWLGPWLRSDAGRDALQRVFGRSMRALRFLTTDGRLRGEMPATDVLDRPEWTPQVRLASKGGVCSAVLRWTRTGVA